MSATPLLHRTVPRRKPLTARTLARRTPAQLAALHETLAASVAAQERTWDTAPTATLPPAAWDAAIVPLLADWAALELVHRALARATAPQSNPPPSYQAPAPATPCSGAPASLRGCEVAA